MAAIVRATVDRYSERYEEHGYSPHSLGWGSTRHMEIRFDALLRAVDLNGRVIVDHGCGFGDLCAHLQKRGVQVREYIGVDVTPALIREAKRRFGGVAGVSFLTVDADKAVPTPLGADVVVLLGVLNFRQEGVDNDRYAQLMLRKAYESCRELAVADFLSSVPAPAHQPDPWVVYRRPADVVDWALEVTPNLSLHHDYLPIPSREMLIVLKR